MYKTLFLLGFVFEIIGQILMAKGNEFVYNQSPIDYAHWFILIGVVLLIPQAVSFPKSVYTYLGSTITIIGIVCIIGMCVIDFIFWSQPDQESRSAVAKHLSQVSSIWKPFISVGPGILNIGLFLLCLNNLKENKIGVALVFVATLIIYLLPNHSKLIAGYSLTLLGFAQIFYRTKNSLIQSDLPQTNSV